MALLLWQPQYSERTKPMLCTRFVQAKGYPDNPCVVKLFYFLLFKMRADRNVGKRQPLHSLRGNFLFTRCFSLREIATS